MKGRRVFGEAFALSALGHLMFFSVFTLIEPEPIKAQPVVPYRVVALGEWPDVAPGEPTREPGAVDPALVRVAGPARAEAPKVSLEHKAFVWDEDPPSVQDETALDETYWRFAKRTESGISDGLSLGLGWPAFREAEVQADLASASEAEMSGRLAKPSVRVRGGLEGRPAVRMVIAPREATPEAAKVVVRMGVDSEGNVRSVLVGRSSGNYAFDAVIVAEVTTWKFAPTAASDDDEAPLQWGWVEITTGPQPERGTTKPDATRAREPQP